jgi:hypothetical protein
MSLAAAVPDHGGGTGVSGNMGGAGVRMLVRESRPAGCATPVTPTQVMGSMASPLPGRQGLRATTASIARPSWLAERRTCRHAMPPRSALRWHARYLSRGVVADNWNLTPLFRRY